MLSFASKEYDPYNKVGMFGSRNSGSKPLIDKGDLTNRSLGSAKTRSLAAKRMSHGGERSSNRFFDQYSKLQTLNKHLELNIPLPNIHFGT